MTEPQEKICQLIVRQQPASEPQLDRLLQSLQAEFGLEAYTARQRLVGPALALFGKGPGNKTAAIADLLRRHGVACWLITPPEPRFAPDLLRELEMHQEHIVFVCRQGTVRLQRGAPVVAVLADLSGGLIDKHLKRLIAQKTYWGRDATQMLGSEEMLQTIFRGDPVFDFYLLDRQGEVRQAVRVQPGRYNIGGLGERAAMSTVGNLQAMVALVEEYAGSFRIYYDFGLSQLPDCQLNRASGEPSAGIENLRSLTRYGWLVCSLKGDGLPAKTPVPEETGLVAGMAAAAVLGQPASGVVLASEPITEAVPGQAEVEDAIRSGLDEDRVRETSTDRSSGGGAAINNLPPPPELTERGISLRKAATIAAMVGGVMFMALVEKAQLGLLRPLLHYGTAAGVFPGLLSIGLFWGGFHFIRLKRQMENTPTSKVRSIAMGMVEVHGRARRIYALVSPMTQSPCIFYRLRKYRRDKNDRWQLVREMDSGHVPFQVDDGTGRVTVSPEGASVRAKHRQSGYPGQSALTFSAFEPEYENEKWIEEVIYEGSSLYVLGYARPLKAEQMSLRERAMAKLRDIKLDRQAMRGYDADGDGRIDEAEWAVARSDAEQLALQEHLAERKLRKRQEEHLVIGRPRPRSLPFVIAETVSEDRLVRKFGLISAPLLIAGLTVFVFAIFKFLEYLQR